MNMKALILAALLATAATAQAEQLKNTSCEVIEVYARTVMDVRQNGVSLKDAMATSDENDTLGPKIIMAAYSKPRYATASIKQRTIDDFADNAYLECLTIKKRH
jgi:hypothetical protein